MTARTAGEAAWLHDPDRTTRSLSRRPDKLLPFDPADTAPDVPVMLDTNVYIARATRRLPAAIVAFVAGREVLHSGVALAELAVTAGLLDPRDARTMSHRPPLQRLL